MTRVMQLVGPQVWQDAHETFVNELRKTRRSIRPSSARAATSPRRWRAPLRPTSLTANVSTRRSCCLRAGWWRVRRTVAASTSWSIHPTDAAAIAEKVIMASGAEAIGKTMVLDLVLRCFVAANGQVATMLAYELRELQDQLAAQRWKRRERSASHSFADVQTHVWRTVVPEPEPPLSTDALRIVVALQTKLAGAPRDVRAYAQGMCDIAMR